MSIAINPKVVILWHESTWIKTLVFCSKVFQDHRLSITFQKVYTTEHWKLKFVSREKTKVCLRWCLRLQLVQKLFFFEKMYMIQNFDLWLNSFSFPWDAQIGFLREDNDMSQVMYVAINLQTTWVKTMVWYCEIHFNECLHFLTDLFDSERQSDLFTLTKLAKDYYNKY